MKEFKYDLTIGMIFRDDIKYIRNCLETMQPLRDALRCQLIMTDTGSVDGSRAVAEEFADILLDFEWCDDFSAARNTGTAIAEGRWFAYFDCDDEMDESILEVAKFLKSKESHKADCISITGLDYKTKDTYTTRQSAIFFNFADGPRYFQFPIHEAILTHTESQVSLPVNIKHWGYMKDLLASKRKRNRPLLEALIEAEPTVLKHRYQMEKELTNVSEKLNYCLLSLEIADKQEEIDFYALILRLDTVKQYLNLLNFTDFDYHMEKLIDLAPDTSFQLESYALCQFRYSKAGDLKKSLEFFEKYYALFNKIENIYSILDTFGNEFEYREKSSLHKAEFDACINAQATDQLPLAQKILSQSEAHLFITLSGEHTFMSGYVDFAMSTKSFHLVKKQYNALQDTQFPDEQENFRVLFRKHLAKLNDEDKANLLRPMIETVTDSFIASLYLQANQYEESAFTPKIISLINSEKDFHILPENLYLFYAYLKNGTDPTGYVEATDVKLLLNSLQKLFLTYPNMGEYVEFAFDDPTFVIKSLKYEKIWSYLGCRTALHMAEQENPDPQQVNKLFSQSMYLMANYAQKIYNPAILNMEGNGVVPSEELFAVFATTAAEEKNPLQYVRSLKEALAVCPAYAPILRLLTAEIAKAEAPPSPPQEKPEAKSEFSHLGEQIKNTIKTLLASGDKVQAKAFLEKYKAISPNDPDIPNLMSQL